MLDGTLNSRQRRTVDELRAEVRSIDRFGQVHVRAGTGRLHKIDAIGRVWDFDHKSWRRPDWMLAGSASHA